MLLAPLKQKSQSLCVSEVTLLSTCWNTGSSQDHSWEQLSQSQNLRIQTSCFCGELAGVTSSHHLLPRTRPYTISAAARCWLSSGELTRRSMWGWNTAASTGPTFSSRKERKRPRSVLKKS